MDDERVIITRHMIGYCHMQVCTVKDATDEEILQKCNMDNPSGTSMGWVEVIRKDGEKGEGPKQCAQYPDRHHLLVVC